MAGPLDEETVRHVARLARLNIADEEIPRLTLQLSRVLAYMEQLQEVDTDGVAPMDHPLSVTNVFRSDRPESSWQPAQAVGDAPQRKGAFFVVPKILEKESE